MGSASDICKKVKFTTHFKGGSYLQWLPWAVLAQDASVGTGDNMVDSGKASACSWSSMSGIPGNSRWRVDLLTRQAGGWGGPPRRKDHRGRPEMSRAPGERGSTVSLLFLKQARWQAGCLAWFGFLL